MLNISAKQYLSRYFFHNVYIRQGQLTFPSRKKTYTKKAFGRDLAQLFSTSVIFSQWFQRFTSYSGFSLSRIPLALAYCKVEVLALTTLSSPALTPPPRRGNVLNHNITASQIEPFLSSIQTLRCLKISQSPQNSCTCNLHQIEKISILKKGSKTIIVLLLVNKYD